MIVFFCEVCEEENGDGNGARFGNRRRAISHVEDAHTEELEREGVRTEKAVRYVGAEER